jgi:hypothetical protein
MVSVDLDWAACGQQQWGQKWREVLRALWSCVRRGSLQDPALRSGPCPEGQPGSEVLPLFPQVHPEPLCLQKRRGRGPAQQWPHGAMQPGHDELTVTPNTAEEPSPGDSRVRDRTGMLASPGDLFFKTKALLFFKSDLLIIIYNSAQQCKPSPCSGKAKHMFSVFVSETIVSALIMPTKGYRQCLTKEPNKPGLPLSVC